MLIFPVGIYTFIVEKQIFIQTQLHRIVDIFYATVISEQIFSHGVHVKATEKCFILELVLHRNLRKNPFTVTNAQAA